MIIKKSVVGMLPITLLASGLALAQNKAEPVQAGSDTTPIEQLDRVIVTATKRATLLQDTPLAVSAFSQKDLEKAGVQDLTSLQTMVPNLSVEQHGDSGGTHVFLRGVGSTNHTELGDPAVAFHIDGVYSPRPQGASALMYDLERVEVARGPQGTLFGRNATAGSINLVTAKPQLGQFNGSTGLTFGNYHHIGIQAALSIPIADKIALRVAAISDRHDGYVDFQPRSNVLPGARKYMAGDQMGLRTTLLWEPSPQVTVTGAIEYYRDNGTGNVALMQQPRAGQRQYSAQIDTAGALDQDNITYRGRADYRLSDALELSYIGSWSSMKRTNASDNDAGTLPGFKQEHRTEWSKFDNYSHELQLKSSGSGPFQWIGGLFAIHEDNRIRFDIDISQIAPPSGDGPIVVNPVLASDTAWAMSFIQPKRTLDSKAVFGQGTLSLSNSVRLTAGARWTTEQKEDVGGRNWVCPQFGATVGSGGHLIGPGGPVTIETCRSEYAPGTWPGGGANDGKIDDSASTYLLRAEFNPTKEVLTYFNVATGFKSGGLSDGGRRHKAEFLTNYELGVKSEFFNRQLAVNLSAFMMKYKDMQVSSIEYQTNGQQQLVTSNAAKASINGLEAELSWRISGVDRLSGQASVLDAKFDDFLTCDSALVDCSLPANVVNLNGNALPHAPKFSLTAAYEHDVLLRGGARLTPRVQVHYQSDSYLNAFNQAPAAANVAGSFANARTQEAYSTVDLSLRYLAAKDQWWVEGYVLNATDKAVKTDASWVNSNWLAFYNAPRTFGARMGYKF